MLVDAQARDVLLRMDEHELIAVRWSDEILDETRRALIGQLNRTPSEADRLLTALRAFPFATVTGYEHLVDALELPDPNDRHVLAAAIHDECDVLVTQNIRDFPDDVLDRADILRLDIDNALIMFARMFDSQLPGIIIDLIAALRNPPTTLEEWIKRLARTAPGAAVQIGASLGLAPFQRILVDTLDVAAAGSPQNGVSELLTCIVNDDVSGVAELVDPHLAGRLTARSDPTPTLTHRVLRTRLRAVFETDGWGFPTGRHPHAPDIELVKLVRAGTSFQVQFEPRQDPTHSFYMRATDDGWVLVGLDELVP